jgi:putative Holliday junction resolvase
MKFFALDIGDVWTGTAISDALGMFARPYKTIETKELLAFLATLTQQEQIATMIVGHPTTLRGTQSQQTLKVEALANELKEQFPTLSWILWDESFSSQQAHELKPAKSKQDKIQSHSIAAAYILSSYLNHINPIQNIF